MTKKELRIISLQFRTLSSQMLKVNSEEEIIYLQAFFDFISKTPFLYEYISSCHTKDYGFDEIFKNLNYHNRIVLPANLTERIDFGYQLLQYILNEKISLIYVGQYYTSTNTFADMISAFMRKVIEPFVVELRNYLEIGLIDTDNTEQEEAPSPITIFLSYCQKDSDIANIIDSRLREKLGTKAIISKDTRDVPYHESFGKFMRSIQDHDYVILLISDNYLKSRNCMFEVTEAIKDSRYDKRIIFIVLKEEDKELLKSHCEDVLGADVYSTDGQAQYTLYWRSKEATLQKQINEIGNNPYAINLIKEQGIVQKILLDLPVFFEFVKDNNGLPLSDHLSENFKSILSFMGLC